MPKDQALPLGELTPAAKTWAVFGDTSDRSQVYPMARGQWVMMVQLQALFCIPFVETDCYR